MDMSVREQDPAERYSAEEWALRCELAGLFRLMDHFGWIDLIYNHISVRVPGKRDEFLINPFGIRFGNMTASDLVPVDAEGTVTDPARADVRIQAGGFVIHSAVHMARPDLNCVIHTHTPAGMGVSAQKNGLLPLTQTAMSLSGMIGYHDFESFAREPEERERIAADLGDGKILFLRNHGTLACGRSIAEAFHHAYWLELACKAQIAALSGGVELTYPPAEIIQKTSDRVKAVPDEHFQLVWDAFRDTLPCDPSEYER